MQPLIPPPVPDDAVLRRPLAPAVLKGRGTARDLPHRFSTEVRVTEDDGWNHPRGGDGSPAVPHADAGSTAGDAPTSDGASSFGDATPSAAPAPVPTRVEWQPAGRILSRNDSPDVPFESSVNPYRGCEHGCIYCYARPTHAYLDLSPGLDFETRLVAKDGAVDALRRELARPGYRPRPINLGSATDAYQPIERELRLTRGIVELFDETSHPFTVVSKSAGILRDLPLYERLARRRLVTVFISLTSLDPDLSRRLEPRAASGARRLQVIRALADAGVWVGLNVAPVIPFLNEPEIERLIEAGAAAGARSVHWTVVRLPWEVRPLFKDWLAQHEPLRAERILARIRDLRGGRDYDADFATRMTGHGVWAQLLRQRFEKACARLGLNRERVELDLTQFRPPGVPGQGELF